MRINRFQKSRVAPTESGEANICGVLVLTKADRLEAVQAELEATAGVEIHGTFPPGRMVVTVEDTPELYAAEIIKGFHDQADILSASLVYHYFDEANSLSEAKQ